MGDFYQNGVVTTLHNLSQRSLTHLEQELMQFSKTRSMGLVLPSLYSELLGTALPKIIEHLVKVPYLSEIVIGLDRADEKQYRHALKFFSQLPQRHRVLWNDGPRLREIDARLQAEGLAPKEFGKGRNVWYYLGYILSSGIAESIALHDCDILTYERSLLARLIYPVANPNFNYQFCKGYYARVANQKINGRVSRLLVTPLLRALKKIFGALEDLEYLDSYRYSLAGEFSFRKDVINDLRIPSDWGLEIGVLMEMKRNYSTNRLAQVDIADSYDHKHQKLSLDDDQGGLSKMSIDISKAIFRKLATNGVVFTPETFRSIKATYYRIALDFIETYRNDAIINGLQLDIHSEEQAVELFSQNLMKAGKSFLEHPLETPFIPSWSRVVSAIPDIFDDLREAVELDNEEYFGKIIGSNQILLDELTFRIKAHLMIIYPDLDIDNITQELIQALSLDKKCRQPLSQPNYWSEEDCIVITYADTLLNEGEFPLQVLENFFLKHLKDDITGIHLLPFFPYSSDDGFAVSDYLTIRPDLGDWNNIRSLSKHFQIMGDLVINHCSSQHEWFQKFLQGQEPWNDYFVVASPEADISKVVRPRNSDLLQPFLTAEGEKHVWCTFGEDQVDLNFANPQVLIEVAKIVGLYLDKGIEIFRLDAVGFLWKEIGTTSLSLPKTHEIVRLLRTLIEHRVPQSVIITETNIPNRENLAYFGNGNEAHMIYNFSLPPLLVHCLLTGNCRHLKTWMMSMPPAQTGTAYLNFIASHDGIGLRPAEGLLSDEEIQQFIERMKRFGGRTSSRKLADGKEKPYEINISLIDAFKGTIHQEDQWQFERFICAHAIMFALEGIPGIYIHSLLGTENDHELADQTQRSRAINRHQWNNEEIEEKLSDTTTQHARVFRELKRLLQIRKKQVAFHPNATQFTLHLGDQIFAFWRQSLSRDQSVFAINNVSNIIQEVNLGEINLIGTDTWKDLISGDTYDDHHEKLLLQPYQSIWLTNKW